MGNTQSAATSQSRRGFRRGDTSMTQHRVPAAGMTVLQGTNSSGSSSENKAYGPGHPVHLDFDNMPFLRAPSPKSQSRATLHTVDMPVSPIPELQTQYQAQAWPMIHHQTSPTMSYKGDVGHTKYESISTNASLSDDLYSSYGQSPPGYSSSGARSNSTLSFDNHSPTCSIVSQLSLLSQGQSPHGSPRSHRHKFSSHSASNSSEIDAGIPPPVPEHFIFPDTLKHNPETEMALAAIEAIEVDIENDCESGPGAQSLAISRTRSRSRSRSRSLSRSLSRAASVKRSVSIVSSMSTDIYTRKCPETPVTPYGNTSTGSEEDTSDDGEKEPQTPEDSSFALSGYNEGATTLRVVNSDMTDGTADKRSSYFVKSKAQLAEEEELRQQAWRKRYARYGHTLRAASIDSFQ